MGTYKDFSQLTATRRENPPPPPRIEVAASPEERALAGSGSSDDYFARLLGTPSAASAKRVSPSSPGRQTVPSAPRANSRIREEQAAAAFAAERADLQAQIAKLKEECEIEREVKEEFAAELAAVRAEIDEARAKAESARALGVAACEQLKKELAAAVKARDEAVAQTADASARADDAVARTAEAERLRNAAVERRDEALAEAEGLRARLASAEGRDGPARTGGGMLETPGTLSEKFAGEIREHLLEALSDALSAAENAGRDRRARLLEAVLCANPPTGELRRRREAVKQIVKGAGAFLDDSAISALEKLGFRYVSGNKHHKLEWAGIRFPVAKTPSDHRSCLNSSNEINNRAF